MADQKNTQANTQISTPASKKEFVFSDKQLKLCRDRLNWWCNDYRSPRTSERDTWSWEQVLVGQRGLLEALGVIELFGTDPKNSNVKSVGNNLRERKSYGKPGSEESISAREFWSSDAGFKAFLEVVTTASKERNEGKDVTRILRKFNKRTQAGSLPPM